MTRDNLAFMVSPTRACCTSRGSRLLLLRGSRVPPSENTKNRPDCGRLHYSLGPTLSAQFQVESRRVPRYLTALPSTGVLRRWRDYMDDGLERSIRHLTYPYKVLSGGGSIPSWSRSVVA
jgi:hypothetical protein